jgi:hypothetical protein
MPAVAMFAKSPEVHALLFLSLVQECLMVDVGTNNEPIRQAIRVNSRLVRLDNPRRGRSVGTNGFAGVCLLPPVDWPWFAVLSHPQLTKVCCQIL